VKVVEEHLAAVARLVAATPREPLAAMADRLWQAYREEAQVFACGNGGSSATASHFIEDLAKGITPPPGRPRFRAISLVDSVPTLTAYGNDLGFEHVFAEPLRNLVRPGDVLVAISCSGRSANVLRAMEAAREAGAAVIALTGAAGEPMEERADICLRAPARGLQELEDAHLVIAHALYLELKARAEAG